MNICKVVLDYIKQYNLKDKRFLIAVSGGADSMVLFDTMRSLNLYIQAAHVNYNFRAEEAPLEEQLVRDYCAKYKIPLHVYTLDGYQSLKDSEYDNLQVFAREQRYRFFRKCMQDNGLGVLATAHHADDNVETVMLNFLKGTGYRGLQGMKVLKEDIFRPLLSLYAQQIRDYALEHKIPFRVDSSNLKDDYDRNFIRNQVAPLLERKFPEWKNNVAKNIQRFQSVSHFYEQYLQGRATLIWKRQDQSEYIDLQKLARELYIDDLILFVFQKLGIEPRYLTAFTQLKESRNGASVDAGHYQLIKDQNKIFFTRKNAVNDIYLFANIESIDGAEIKIAGFTLSFTVMPAMSQVPREDGVLYVNADKCLDRLTIRLNRPGDYFYPFGLKKKKKVVRFLADKKLPQTIRQSVPLIFCGEYCIAIAGVEIDYRFAIDSKSKRWLRIVCSK